MYQNNMSNFESEIMSLTIKLNKLKLDLINLKMQSGRRDEADRPDSGVDLLDEVETKEPPLYKVLILNDDYTPMDFVVRVLQLFFKHDERSAEKIMLDVHKLGSGVAGIYNFEVAETKAMQVNQFAKSHKYPLKCIIEEDKSE
jgi:ATP-dependent Clp protease adaptor protein ClpS